MITTQKISKISLLILALLLCGHASAFAKGTAGTAGKVTIRDMSIDAHYMMLGVLGTGLPPASNDLKLTKVEATPEVAVATTVIPVEKIAQRIEPRPLVHLNTGILPATAGMRLSGDEKKK